MKREMWIETSALPARSLASGIYVTWPGAALSLLEPVGASHDKPLASAHYSYDMLLRKAAIARRCAGGLPAAYRAKLGRRQRRIS
jgi:hypothetical protein